MLDVDSTLSGIEGIDFLATYRGNSTQALIEAITGKAMRGEVALEGVYAERLNAVRPSASEIHTLRKMYVLRMEAGAPEALAAIANLGVKIVLVSAGILDAIIPLAEEVGVAPADVHAVRVYLTESGHYAGFNTASPLTRNGGKVTVVRSLNLPRPILAVGDGMTDAELKTAEPPVVDAFAAYIGVVEREPVVRVADYTVRDFAELLALFKPL